MLVYTREPDDADEYNFFSGARFAALGASSGVSVSLKEMGIEKPSHIQALSYRALAGAAEQQPGGDDAGNQAGEGAAAGAVAGAADGHDAMKTPKGWFPGAAADGQGEGAEQAEGHADTPPQHVLLADQAYSTP